MAVDQPRRDERALEIVFDVDLQVRRQRAVGADPGDAIVLREQRAAFDLAIPAAGQRDEVRVPPQGLHAGTLSAHAVAAVRDQRYGRVAWPLSGKPQSRQAARRHERRVRHPPAPTRVPCARRAAREITCADWLIEAAYRMIQNNLDPEVAENPDALVVYGGIGKAARNWDCFDAILDALRALRPDETLLVQSGKPVGVFRTHADAPRVLIANSNLVPKWASWEHFNELDRKGLMMYGQMTAGSWIYIGSQGIVQGTYETFVEAGRQHYGGDLAGRWILTAGLGGMGGAQPLAATFAGAVSLTIECQQRRIDFRLRSRYLDEQAGSLDDALARVAACTAAKEARSIGLLGNAAEILPELARRGIRPDLVTDQTSAHDLINGYLPPGWSVERWLAAQARPGAARRTARRRRRRLRRARAGDAGVPDRWACRRSTTATTSARSRSTPASGTRSTSPASCRPTSGRCSAAASARSAGSRCRATPRTSAGPTRR